jgi:hypothetical protein
MTNVQRAAEVRGKTIRLTWLDGPTKGKTHEHHFHEDGTVDWKDADAPSKPSSDPKPASSKKERVEYAAVKISSDVYLVSYLADSGFTLTVALNFDDNRVAGFASSSTEWHPVSGTFEVADT